MQKQKKIGMLKIKQTEYISSIIDIFVNSSGAKYHLDEVDKLIHIANKKGIFWNLHEMFIIYPHSNLYQILYKRIIEIVTNEHSPESLIEAFFFEKGSNKRKLIDFYIEKEISEDMKLNHPLTKIYTMNPCFTFLNSILYQIYTSQNKQIRQIIENHNDIHVFVEIMVEEFEKFNNYKLLYKDPLDALCSNNTTEEPSPFGSKNLCEIYEENCHIYNQYKKGEDYKSLLNEKKKRQEKEISDNKDDDNKKENENNKGIQYIDDLDDEFEDEDPLFKVEKMNLKNAKEDFLASLDKPTEELNKENNNDNDNGNEDNIYKGRFKFEDLDEIDEDKIKDKNDDNNINNINNIEDINDDNNKINDDSTPDELENKIYHVDYDKIEKDIIKENEENKTEDKKEEETKEENKNKNE